MSSRKPPDVTVPPDLLTAVGDPEFPERHGAPLSPDETTPTADQIARAQSESSRLAGEPVRVERLGSWLHALGSELACLRLYHRFRGRARVEYSRHLGSWTFRPPVPGEAL
jgi:hypothetical protein